MKYTDVSGVITSFVAHAFAMASFAFGGETFQYDPFSERLGVETFLWGSESQVLSPFRERLGVETFLWGSESQVLSPFRERLGVETFLGVQNRKSYRRLKNVGFI